MAKKNKKTLDKDTILKNIEELDLKIKDINIQDLVPNVIDDIMIIVEGHNQELHLPDNVTGDKFKRWLRSRGGVFSKDTNRWSKNKSHGKYVVLRGEDEKIIARLIEDDELEAFSFFNLIDGKIKDKAYMIFKRLKNDESLIQI